VLGLELFPVLGKVRCMVRVLYSSQVFTHGWLHFSRGVGLGFDTVNLGALLRQATCIVNPRSLLFYKEEVGQAIQDIS
jgi:hypothetical protein